MAEPRKSETSRLAARMERISLEQALSDFETANARAIELQSRVVELEQEVARLEARLALWRRAVGPLLRMARAVKRRLRRA